jgi:uncharacterized protein (UPF0303 family)
MEGHPDELATQVVGHPSAVVLAAFDYAVAGRLGLALHELAGGRKLPVGIEVFHGTAQVFLALLPGAKPDNIEWLRRKRNLVMRFHQSSLSMRLDCEAKGVDFNARYGVPKTEYVASGGSVPIVVRGAGLVGCATVSGLPDTEDDALVREALASLTGPQGA